MAKPLSYVNNKLHYIYSYIEFLKDFFRFKSLVKRNNRFSIKFGDRYPCFTDKTTSTGFDAHYIYHTAWAARALIKINPECHVDISSYLYFSTIVSAFLPVKFYDYRPANIKLTGLKTDRADLLSLPFEDGSIKSLSCMHTIEHIGLGRYGDPIDPDADLKAISELKRVLATGGSLLFVVPVGKPKIAFNAHRIYSCSQIMDYFSDLILTEFALISDNTLDTGIVYAAGKELVNQQAYGCGCFWFTKK